jgi:hypothetical protein
MGKAAEPSVEPRPAFPLSNQLTFGRSRTYDEGKYLIIQPLIQLLIQTSI